MKIMNDNLRDGSSTVSATVVDKQIKDLEDTIALIKYELGSLKDETEEADIEINQKINLLTNHVSELSTNLEDDIEQVQNNLDAYKIAQENIISSSSGNFSTLNSALAVLESVKSKNIQIDYQETNKAIKLEKGSILFLHNFNIDNEDTLVLVYGDTDSYVSLFRKKFDTEYYITENGIVGTNEVIAFAVIGNYSLVDHPETKKTYFTNGLNVKGDITIHSNNFNASIINSKKIVSDEIETLVSTSNTSVSKISYVDKMYTSSLILKDNQTLNYISNTDRYLITLPDFNGVYMLKIITPSNEHVSLIISHLEESLVVQYGTTRRIYLEAFVVNDNKFSIITRATGNLLFGCMSEKPAEAPKVEVIGEGAYSTLDKILLDDTSGTYVLKGEFHLEKNINETGNLPIGLIVMATDETTLEQIHELGGVWEETTI